ncbi:serine-threonine protein kinase, putative [Entamoeba dispar SAW760]|uniref:Serine-threonine protein kinase, putative n=1 Tax=Entamoeba dispar (strain ATCC PRA-260 / SAW760) TaxID=370354 RepID=B0EDR0_ENTDS|nr:serine-threonine protein kinase, putative [Entamoeba dispar SAW760]EDR27323.1 serine-threonine protein kinase, putative [Entamoeba dispar SAW760]|eukprot:EDR27323.1 serine-threonine protein kinase, putative [Entamoeba dispar SAW760]
METRSFDNIVIEGYIIDGKYNGEVKITQKEIKQEIYYTMKSGMVLVINQIPSVEEHIFELFPFPHSYEIEQIVNEYQFIFSKLNIFEEVIVSAESIQQVIETSEKIEELILLLELLSKPISIPINISFLNTKTGELQNLIDVISYSTFLERVIKNLCFGNYLYLVLCKRCLEHCLLFSMNKEIGMVLGELLKNIENNCSEENKRNITSSIQVLCSNCQIKTLEQYTLLKRIKIIKSFWRNIKENEKERFIRKQIKEIGFMLYQHNQIIQNPKKLMIETWKYIYNILKTNDNIINIIKPLFIIIIASYSKNYIENIGWIIDICKNYIEMNLVCNNSECDGYILTIIEECKMILIDQTKPIDDVINNSIKNVWNNEISIEYFKSIEIIEKQLNNKIPLWNYQIKDYEIIPINSKNVVESISKGNIDLFHFIISGSNPILKEYLTHFLLYIHFPWERNIENGSTNQTFHVTEKTTRCLLFYLMYSLGNSQIFEGNESLQKLFLKLIKNLIERDDIKMITLNQNNKENAMILKRYFKITKDIQCSLYYFHSVLLNNINNINFIKNELISIYEQYLHSQNDQLNEMMIKNRQHISELFKHLNDKKELENYALKFLGEICVKTEDTSIIQIEQNEKYIKKLIFKSRNNLIKYFNKINENELLIGKELGKGVYATVKSGYYKGNKVAIKIFNENSYQFRSEDFLQEIAIMSLLHNENIIKTYGATVNMKLNEESTFYIISELAINGNLEELIYKKSIHEENKLKMILEIAKGLKYLHELKIIHRDLKPANILIGNNFTIKISDFGLSAFVNEKKLDVILGSYKWMSPERFLKKKYGKPADVYAFGIISWQILELDEPFQQYVSVEDLQNAICSLNERPPLTNISINMKKLLARCWNKTPNKRPNFVSIIKELLINSID